VLYTFLSVTLVLCAELAWWVTFNIRASHRMTDAAITRLERDVRLADAVIVRLAQSEDAPPDLPAYVLGDMFPQLLWSAQSELEPGASLQPQPSAALQRLYPGFAVRVRAEAIAQVHQGHHAHRRMFVSEGGFFLAMLLLGATLIFRTLKREVGLMHQQSNFLAAVSHELKSPLASIRLYTETMQLREVPQQMRTKYLGIMRIDIDRLETLVGNLLAVARLDHGEQLARPQNIDVCRAVADIVSDMAEEMQARGTPVRTELWPQPLYAVLDAGILTTVLRNLLDNAAKYNQHNAPVLVRLTEHGAKLKLEVVDQGIGLEAKELKRIFQKFYRVGDEMVRQAEGSGLGLYLVHALWRQSGGQVWAFSPGVNLGTTVTLSLPKSAQTEKSV
jgi:signal transduction histidine kinase